jgi:hypothetical protein
MGEVGGVQGTDECNVINMSGEVRQQLGNPHTAVAVLPKAKRASHERSRLRRETPLLRQSA